MGSCCPGPHGSAPDNEIYHPFIAYTQDTLQWVASLVTKLVFLEAKEMRDIRHHNGNNKTQTKKEKAYTRCDYNLLSQFETAGFLGGTSKGSKGP